MAKFDWVDAYNFARVNPGWASTALLFAWPLFIALAAVAVVLSPLVFVGGMIGAYVLKATNAPAMEKPKPKVGAAASAGSGASYHDMYPEVKPKADLRKLFDVASRIPSRRDGRRRRCVSPTPRLVNGTTWTADHPSNEMKCGASRDVFFLQTLF